uniref:diacylglycerol O-acyltransferase n=1 Tax=Myripristis murdjan TaxID=586833 RepID=A0A667YAA3_9TELE
VAFQMEKKSLKYRIRQFRGHKHDKVEGSLMMSVQRTCAYRTCDVDSDCLLLVSRSSCHRVQDSLLSSNSSFTGYRGVLNWIIILKMCRCLLIALLLNVCPLGGAFFSLWSYTVLGLKLYSYQETNQWYRQGHLTGTGMFAPPGLLLVYLYYFLLAPTLCYQRDFPRTPKVRINKLLHRLLEMVSSTMTDCHCGFVLDPFLMVSTQKSCAWLPVTCGLSHPQNMDLTMRVEHLVGLAPTHFLWLLFFFLSHSYLNFCAELLHFGDRHFYGDWWNATTLTLVVAVFLGCYFQGNYGNGLVWLCLLLGPPLAVTTYFHDHYVGLHRQHSSSSPPS